MNQPILLYRSGSVYANETAAWAALDAVTHKKGQPIVAFYTLSSPVSGHHGSSTIGAIFAIGIGDGVGQYKACTSHDDMLIVAQSLNAHITQFNQMFEYDATNNAIKAKLDFYTTDGKSISAGGIGSGSSASLGALYQLVDVMANSSNTGVEGAVEGSVLAYDATAGKWKAIAQSEILPDMSGYYTKDETDAAINTAKSNLQGQVDTLKALIPATASATNPLADKDFVNSSIATATAEFRGSFTSLDELKATSGNLNDYAFYLHTDNVGNKVVDRYKWTTAGWLYEYTLNNSSFTAEQWAALNSAITATLVQSYNSHLDNTTIHITAAERNAWNNKWDYNEETIKGVKVNAAVNADYATSAGDADTLDGFDASQVLTATSSSIIDLNEISAPKIHRLSNANPNLPSTIFSYGNLLTVKEKNADTTWQLLGSYSSDALCFRRGTWYADGTGSLRTNAWKVIAFTDSNVASATKLQTPRTLWGKPFDGLSDVSGDLTDVGNITASGKATIQGDIISGGEVVAIVSEGTPAGVTDYSALTGKPAINGITLVSGNNTLATLGIQAAGDYATNSGVTTLLADYTTKTFVSNNYAGKSAFYAHTADTDIHITSAERKAWNAKWDYDENTIKAVKVNSALSADSADTLTSNAGTSAIPIYFDGGIPIQCIPSDLFSGFDNAYSSTETSLGITIAGHTRMVVVAYSQTAGSVAWTGITGKPSTFTPSAHKHAASDITGLPTALKNPFAVEIKANGVSLGTYDGSKAATFNLSAANVGAASKIHTHTASEITGLPTKLSVFTNDVGYITGITKSMVEGVLTGDITSHTHSYLPLTGGTLTGSITLPNIYVTGVNSTLPSHYFHYLYGGNSVYEHFGEESDRYKVTYGNFRFFNGNGSYKTLYLGGDGAFAWDGSNVLTASNYNSYAPTLTGTGASGTWGISISGNAATATKLATPRTIWGQNFDGNGDILYTAIPTMTYVLFNKNTSTSIGYIGKGGSADHLYFGGYNGVPITLFSNDKKSSNNLTIATTGNILIGTTTDNGYKLDVNGKGHYSGDLVVDGEVSALVA